MRMNQKIELFIPISLIMGGIHQNLYMNEWKRVTLSLF